MAKTPGLRHDLKIINKGPSEGKEHQIVGRRRRI